MRTVVLGPMPIELSQWIERRRATGADLYDEVWEGEYHMAPAPHAAHALLDERIAAALRPHVLSHGLDASGPFNLGELGNFRVPDRGVHRVPPTTIWVPTAALVVEIISPDDESWAKLPFYAAHGVDEVVIVDPQARTVSWLARAGTDYQPVDHSDLLDVDVDVAVFTSEIDWPAIN